jgi:hypothetical protein
MAIAGWYDDPAGKGDLRYWDGAKWTERTKQRGSSVGAEAVPLRASRVVKKRERSRSELCFIGWTWRDQSSQDRRIRKSHPYEIWFVARAIGPKGIYRAAESDITFNTHSIHYYNSGRPSTGGIVRWMYEESGGVGIATGQVPRTSEAVACLNDLIKKLWADGWEPSGGGGKNSLWYEYRFRRPVAK